jgi:hypothetical protein
MSQGYYTLRLRVISRTHVQGEVLDPQNNLLREPNGNLRYADELRDQIDTFKAAAQGKALFDNQVKAFGETLFEALFNDGIRHEFYRLYNETVHGEKQLLRIELDINEGIFPALAALPWEFMRVPTGENMGAIWLGTAPSLILSRRRSQGYVPQPIRIDAGEKLRIGFVVAAPEELGEITFEEEFESLEKLATKYPQRFELLPVLKEGTPDKIDRLLENKPHILHFSGHGRLLTEDQNSIGQIALVDDWNEALWVDAEYFSELLNQHRPGIVLLQACESGRLSDSEAFVGVASRVVQQNIPVVVAMQYKVSNITASIFARSFYEEIAKGKPVDQAAQIGRRRIALSPMQNKSRDFATPVLFMRVQDGHLFEWEKSPRAKLTQAPKKTPVAVTPPAKTVSRTTILEKLRVDTALPDTVFGGQTVVFAVAIRHPDSEKLSVEELKPDGGETAAKPTPGSLRFTLQMFLNRYNAFYVEGPEQQTVYVQPGGDPPIVYFRLRPRRPILMEAPANFRPAGAHLARLQLQIDLGDKRVFDETFETQFSDQPPYAAPLRLRSNLFPSDKAESLFLTAQLRERLDANSLYELCAAVDTHPENLPGDARPAKARELISYCTRTAKLPILQKKCQELWPDGHWYLLAAEVAKAG